MNKRDCENMEMKRNGKRILVTGGAGFIGSHLCRALLAKGHTVICMDNFFTGDRENIADLMSDPSFTFVQGDVTKPFDFNVEEIYHLACPASPVHYRADPIYTAKTCFLGAIHVLEVAERHSAKVLLTSTSEVYGEPEEHPQKESYRGSVNQTGPRACYNEGKRIAETLFFDAHRTKNIGIRVVRIFNTYGPCMEEGDGRVIPNFIRQALAGEDVVVYGDGQQTRSFCYIDDTVRGLIRMMENEGPAGDAEMPAAPYIGPVNIGNPEERTILSAAEEIIKLTGSRSGIVYGERPKDDPTRRQPDISRAKAWLRWEPEVTFSEGIEKTITYYRKKEEIQ